MKMNEEWKEHLRLSAIDVHRLFQIAIHAYILTSVTLLIYEVGVFFSLSNHLILASVCKGVASLMAFSIFYRLYSAVTMKGSVKQILQGRMTTSELFTVPVAKKRITGVLFHTFCTLLLHGFVVKQIDLRAMGDSDTILLWGMMLTWIVGGFVFGYSKFFIERGRCYIESRGKIV